MYVSYDPALGVTYVKVEGGIVQRTVHLSDLVMVDVDARGRALGVEFLYRPAQIPDDALKGVVLEFPELESLIETDWRFAQV